jgi:hypothetical protein
VVSENSAATNTPQARLSSSASPRRSSSVIGSPPSHDRVRVTGSARTTPAHLIHQRTFTPFG